MRRGLRNEDRYTCGKRRWGPSDLPSRHNFSRWIESDTSLLVYTKWREVSSTVLYILSYDC